MAIDHTTIVSIMIESFLLKLVIQKFIIIVVLMMLYI